MNPNDIPQDVTLREFIADRNEVGDEEILGWRVESFLNRRELMGEKRREARLAFLFGKEGYTDDEA